MHKYAFATLALGVEHNYKVRTLIDCVNILTKGDVIVITDDVPELTTYVSDHPELDVDRIHIVEFTSVSDQNIWFAERMFNFNLKILPTKVAYERGGYDMIIHSDADGFLIGWDEEDFQNFIAQPEQGLIARFRNRPCEEGGIAFLLDPKAQALSIDMNKIKAKMPIEVFMFFKPKCPEFKTFMDTWVEITKRCHDRGINPFIEALEISYAMNESNLPNTPILNFMRTNPVLHTFRYLHHDKIMRII